MIFPHPRKEEYSEGTLPGLPSGKCDLVHFCKTVEKLPFYHYEAKTDFTEDEYTLRVCEEGVFVGASGPAGVFRALTSLRAISDGEGAARYVDVYDKPQFVHRGYMVDISTARMPKLPELYRLVDYLAELKYNELQLCMQSIVFQYEQLSELTRDVETLTADDIEALDAYCRERYIELVPHQNTFGHLGAWMTKPELNDICLHNEGRPVGVLNILKPEAFEFLDKLLGSLLPHFSSKRVNICLDEAFFGGTYELEDVCREKGKAVVVMEWLNRVSKLCEEKYGKTVQFWSDLIISNPETFHMIPKNATVLHWAYDLIGSSMFDPCLSALRDKGQKFYICPGNAAWLSYTGRFDVMSFNVRTAGEVGRKYGADGYLMTDWGSGDGHVHFPVFTLIPAALAAVYAWYDGVEQAEGNLKANNIHDACRYVDGRFFDGKNISDYIYRLCQYYLLEPERIHSSTEACLLFRLPLSETGIPGFADMKDVRDDFHFDMVETYLRRVMADYAPIEFDEKFKRQMNVDANMAILATKMLRVRCHQSVDPGEIKEILSMMDEITVEYKTLWDMDNYPAGVEKYLKLIEMHRKDLLSGKFTK